jgi:signal transduction histidine kinase
MGICTPIYGELMDIPFMQAENLARPMAQAKKLDLTMTVGPDVPEEVIGDEKRLLQVTLNILGNAVKFTKQVRCFPCEPPQCL